MDEKERRELVARIERNEYVTYEMLKFPMASIVSLVISIVILYPVFLLARAIILRLNFERIAEIISKLCHYYPFVALGIVFLVTGIRLVVHVRKKSQIYNLGSLTMKNKQLIMHGEVIEAKFDKIESSEKGSVLKCYAEPNGKKQQFISPAIRAEFLPIENSNVLVFMDKNNPNEYLVNIYNHIPRKGPKVLTDQTQLKYEEKSEEEHWARIVIAIIVGIMVVFLWPLALALVAMLMAAPINMIESLIAGNMNSFYAFAAASFVEFVVIWFMYAKIRKTGAFRHKGSRLMRPTNYYLPVKVNKYWTTEYKVKGENGTVTHKVHHISARYIEPSTNYVYDFFATGPSIISRVNGQELHVFVNPKNMNKYNIDYVSAIHGMGLKYTETGFTYDQNGVWYEK